MSMKDKHQEIEEAKNILREQNMEEVEESRVRDEVYVHQENQLRVKLERQEVLIANLYSFIADKGLYIEYLDYIPEGE